MLELKNIYKTYRSKNGVTHRALNNVSLSFDETGLVFIVGKSGGGKSTLLNIIGALDTADKGSISLYGNDFASFTQSKYDSYRNSYIGVVFQEYNLIPTLTVYQNVALALGLRGETDDVRVTAVLEKIGLAELANRKPNELSGGQCQRVAIARAIVKNPKMILADEPTGNLDSKTGAEMFEIFKELSKEKLVIIVTHDREIADSIGDRVIEIKDGRIHKDIVCTSETYEKQIDMVGDRLIRIPSGAKIDEYAMKTINETLLANEKDTYIINERDTQKVKSMNLHVKHAVDIEMNNDAVNYFPYRPKEIKKSPIKLIKAKMPFGTGLKLSLSTFKYKKFRLVLTVIMLTLSLTLSCAIAAISHYDDAYSYAKTVVHDGIKTLYITKDVEFAADENFDADELEKWSELSGGIAPVYAMELTPKFIDPKKQFDASVPNRLFKSFSGIGEVDDTAEIGYNALYGSSALTEYNQAVISRFVAEMIAEYGIFADVTPTTVENIIGKQMTVFGKIITVSGVFDHDMTEVNAVREYMESIVSDNSSDYGDIWRYIPEGEKFSYDLRTLFNIVFVKQGFINNYSIEQEYINGAISLLGKDEIPLNVAVVNEAEAEDIKVLYECRDITDGVYISAGFARQMFRVPASTTLYELVDEFNGENNDYVLGYASSQKLGLIYNDLKIKGVIDEAMSVIYISNDDFCHFASESIENNALILKTFGSVRDNVKLIRTVDDSKCAIDSNVAADYYAIVLLLSLLQSTLEKVLYITAAISVFLMYSFISASTRLEARQIGILRGMGARGIDTFKTFAIEGSIISAFSLVLSAIACSVTFPMMNAKMSSANMIYFFSVTPYMAVFMIAVAALITALSIAVPLFRLVKMTPVNAINAFGNQR